MTWKSARSRDANRQGANSTKGQANMHQSAKNEKKKFIPQKKKENKREIRLGQDIMCHQITRKQPGYNSNWCY